MRWRKALTVLAARKKIDAAAMFDMQGHLLSRTENFAENQEHIDSVLNVLRTSAHLKLLKLRVFGDVYTCMSPGPAGVLLATAEDRLFVAVRTQCCVVIAFADQEARGSCLYEVMEFTKLLETKVYPRIPRYTMASDPDIDDNDHHSVMENSESHDSESSYSESNRYNSIDSESNYSTDSERSDSDSIYSVSMKSESSDFESSHYEIFV